MSSKNDRTHTKINFLSLATVTLYSADDRLADKVEIVVPSTAQPAQIQVEDVHSRRDESIGVNRGWML